MRIKLQPQALRETKATEYLSRFLYGGVVTVIASLIAHRFGPVIGGLFLAFPGIFPAGVRLVEKHKIEREAEESKNGVISARGQASIEAAGASSGAAGMVAFAAVLWWGITRYSLGVTLLAAVAAWAALSCTVWLLREKI